MSIEKFGTYQKCIIFGIVTRVGEFKEIGYDNLYHIDFTLKTTEYYTPKKEPGVIKEFVKWHQCRAYGKMAEIINNNNIELGDLIKIEGPFDYSRNTDISASVNQYVSINVHRFNLILKNAVSENGNTILQQSSEIEDDEIFDFQPIEIENDDLQ